MRQKKKREKKNEAVLYFFPRKTLPSIVSDKGKILRQYVFVLNLSPKYLLVYA